MGQGVKLGRAPSIQWYYKQYLGDNKVLAMDWDVRGMHMHLLMLSVQEEPPGTIPADDAAIRRWLSLPLGSVDADQTWRRVKSQLLAAWQPEGDRLANPGMKATMKRASKYRDRYETGTKKPPDSMKYEEEVSIKSSSKEETTNLQQATQFLFITLGLAGLQNRVKCQDAIRAFIYDRKCDELTAAQELSKSWERYGQANIKYRTNVLGFLEKAVWKVEESWTSNKSQNSTGGW